MRDPASGGTAGPGAAGAAAPPGAALVLQADRALHAALSDLARRARLVFFAGLPGTGKSLLIHQLAHLAHARGRRVQLLQWDVARPVLEAAPAGQRYPQVGGITHALIRVAVGRWARAAVARWDAEHPGLEHLLIGETPFVGHRFIELARREPDAAEATLAGPWTRFVIPVPSPAVRAHVEAERIRRAREPLHQREREDAPPDVLLDMWRMAVEAARELGLTGKVSTGTVSRQSEAPEADMPWDPDLYRRLYERLLAHRHVLTLAVETVLPAGSLSPYAFQVPAEDLTASPEEARRYIEEAEADWPDSTALRQVVDTWYAVG